MSELSIDLSSKRKSDQHEMTKKRRVNEGVDKQYFPSEIQNFTMDSLPDHMIHLGGNIFTYVNSFKGQIRVHIRVFSKDDNNCMHPTKNGVSLKLKVWSDLLRKMCHFKLSEDPDAVLIVRKDVCLFNHTANYKCCVSLQRLFQKKDLSFQLLPEHVVLNVEQFSRLRDSHELVLESIKNKLLSYTFNEYVLREILNHPDDRRWNLYDGETPAGVDELTDVLCKYITDSISNNLSLIVKKNCDFCNCDFSVFHNCMDFSKQECFNIHFEEALYDIDWHVLAVKFVNTNINRPYLRQLAYEFFECLDTKSIFKKVEEMYVNEQSTVIVFPPL